MDIYNEKINDDMIYELLDNIANVGEPDWKQNPKLCYDYAYYVIKGRWPEAEPIIKQDKDDWVRYVTNINLIRKKLLW